MPEKKEISKNNIDSKPVKENKESKILKWINYTKEQKKELEKVELKKELPSKLYMAGTKIKKNHLKKEFENNNSKEISDKIKEKEILIPDQRIIEHHKKNEDKISQKNPKEIEELDNIKTNKEQNNNEEIKKTIPENVLKLSKYLCTITGLNQNEFLNLIRRESQFNNNEIWENWTWIMQITTIALDDMREWVWRWIKRYKPIFESIPDKAIDNMKCSTWIKIALKKLKNEKDITDLEYNNLLSEVIWKKWKYKNITENKNLHNRDINLLIWSMSLAMLNNSVTIEWNKVQINWKNEKDFDYYIKDLTLEHLNSYLKAKDIPELNNQEYNDLKNKFKNNDEYKRKIVILNQYNVWHSAKDRNTYATAIIASALKDKLV